MKTKIVLVTSICAFALGARLASAQAPQAPAAGPPAAQPPATAQPAPTPPAATPPAATPPSTGGPTPAGGTAEAPAPTPSPAAGPAAPGSTVPAPSAGPGSIPPPGAAPAAGAAPPVVTPGQAAPVKAWYDVLAEQPHDTGGNFWLPVLANEAGAGVDWLYIGVLGMSFFFFFAIAGVTIYFVVRYRHRPGHKAEPSAAHNDTLEITWTVIPTLIVVFLFFFGWREYIEMVTPPQRAVEIQVTARKWEWQFTHANGVTDSNLHVPANTAVRLVMTSADVLHSFYSPAFRTKQDIVPRRYTFAWFKPTRTGVFRLYCAEYCGTDHSMMKRAVVVHSPGDYERYLADAQAAMINLPPIQLGERGYTKKGCVACHTTDGTPRVGPSFKGIFGSTITLKDGSTITVDENYIRESILSPQSKARPGYPPSMPSFEGQLKEKELMGLIEFIKSKK